MSRIRANKITNKIGTGAIELEKGAHLPIGMGITGAGGLNITGVVTATSFSGSGANLTGIDATAIKDSGGNVKIQAQASGAVYTGIHTFTTLNATTITPTTVNATSINATTGSFTGSVSIGGTLTYEDVINVDSVGVITARSGIDCNGDIDVDGHTNLDNVNIVGVTTFAGNILPGTDSSHNIGSNGVRFANAYVDTYYGDGSNLTGIEVGISTEALVKTNGQTASLDLSKDDHKVTATGTVTIDVTGGTEPSSHTLRIVNSGIATVGFSTYFLFPSGGTPVLPTTSGAISLISFTVHRAGAVGVSTQLLSGSSVNFS
jgi:hypothetical protein